MISPQEFIAQYGTDNLVRYNEAVVERLNIPTASKQFLGEAGLPKQYYPEACTFRALPDLPFLGETFGGEYPIPLMALSYRVFCAVECDEFLDNKIWKFYCLDEQTTSHVMQVLSRGRKYWDAGFLNSSLPQFVEFLLVISEFKRWYGQRIVEQEQSIRPFRCSELDQKMHSVRQKLHLIDRDAFTVMREGERFSDWELFLLETEIQTGCID